MNEVSNEYAVLPAQLFKEDFSRNGRRDWHWHDEMEIDIVKEGQLHFMGEDSELTVNEGDAVFVNSKVRHTLAAVNEDYCLIYTIRFDPRLVGGSRDSIFWQNYVHPVERNRSAAFVVLHTDSPEEDNVISHAVTACTALGQKETGYEFEVRSELSYFLFEIWKKTTGTETGLSPKDLRNEKRIRDMLGFIEEHYHERISLEDIAGSASLSVSECIRCFKRTMHTTPVTYLIRFRVLKSADLLTQTDMSIQDIGFQCGFEEISYYNRCFKKVYLVTPSQYRKTYCL